MLLSLECTCYLFEAVNDFCRLSSQNATTCSVALAFKGTWRSGTGNALAVVCHLARVMSGMSTFNKEPADLALLLLINHVLLFCIQLGGCNPNATPISEQTVYLKRLRNCSEEHSDSDGGALSWCGGDLAIPF